MVQLNIEKSLSFIGKESLEAYAEGARMVAEERGTYFWDVYHDLGINEENKKLYLSDGVHLSEQGRELYAGYAAQRLAEIKAE